MLHTRLMSRSVNRENNMSVDSKTVSCGNCGVKLNEDPGLPTEKRNPCPSCGSTTRIFHVIIRDTIMVKSKLAMKGRHLGRGKPFIEQVHGDGLQRETSGWMKLSRIIDRENDQYHEVVIDPISGKVVHECKEPLSKHRGHGAAKYKKNLENNCG